MKPKNTIPSAPEDYLEPGQMFAEDGRKRQDTEFVGAKTPDTDADITKPYRRRRARALKERSVRRASAQNKAPSR